MPDLKQHILDYHGAEIFFWKHHKKDAPTILVIPGLSGDHTDLSQLVEYLSKDFSVIIPDLPGWGKSEELRGKNTLERYADVLTTLIHEHGSKDLILVGHCMGSAIAVLLAEKTPQSIRQIFLLNPPYGEGQFLFALLKKAGEMGTKAPEILRPLFFFWQYKPIFFIFSIIIPRFRTFKKRFSYAVDKFKQDPPLPLFEENTLGIYTFDWSRIKSVPIPIHIIHGEKDLVVPLKQVESLVTTAKRKIDITIIPASGHLLPMERPGEVAHLIRDNMIAK